MSNKNALITGCLGQDGILLTRFLNGLGYKVYGTTHRQLASISSIDGIEKIYKLNLDDCNEVNAIVAEIKPTEIYLLAAKSSSASLMQDPVTTTLTNGVSVVNFLEAVRLFSQQSKICFAASSEVFAGADVTPQTIHTPVYPVNFYGAAKCFAWHMIKIYRHSFGIKAGTAILYNHESIHRKHNYVSRKITSAAARIKLGIQQDLMLESLSSQRDWMHANDAVNGMWLMLQQDVPEDYVFGSGKLHSVEDICRTAFEFVGLDYRQFVKIKSNEVRRSDAIQLIADISAATEKIGWKTTVSFEDMIQEMTAYDLMLESVAKVE